MHNSYVENIKWHLFIGKLYGFVHFSNSKYKKNVRRLLFLWSIILTLTYIYVIYEGMKEELDDFKYGNKRIIDIIFGSISAFSLIFSLLFHMIINKSFRKIILEINNIPNGCVYKNRVISLIICILVIVFSAIYDFIYLKQFKVYYILLITLSWHNSLIEQMIIYEIVRGIKCNMIELNMQIRIMATIKRKLTNGNPNEITYRIIRKFGDLSCIIYDVNSMIGIRMLVIIFTDLCFAIYTLKQVYYAVQIQKFEEVLSYVKLVFLQCIMLIIIIKCMTSITMEVSIIM